MANIENKVFENSLCSNECKKNIDSLNSKIKDLKSKLSEANNFIYHYKLAMAQLEGRLTEYKEREEKYIVKIRTLEMYRACNLDSIKILTKELEEVKLEKDGLDGKLAGLLKALENLDHLIESQRSDQVKEGVGYNAIPPPAADLYLSPKKDLSWTGLPEFVDDTVTDYSRPAPTVVSTSAEGQNKDSSTSEDVASPNPPKPFVKFVKPKDSEPESKSKEQETPKESQVKYVEQYRHSNKRPKGNQRNWNNLKFYQLGPEFVLHKKSCFNCGDFSHLANDCRRRVQRETTRSQNHLYKSSSHRSGGHRPHGAPMRPPLRSSGHRPHGGSMRPSHRSAGHRPHGPSMNPRRPTMNGNISYLSDFEPFDGGYVSFGQGGCKITCKGTIKTDSECIVLGRNFKLLHDTNILLRTPRQHNMYSIDQNYIVPHKDLTCLVAKASADECILWHRRLGHLNVKTMNKLVRHNLVRGLPTKSFDNDHTCTTCLKGKQHKASLGKFLLPVENFLLTGGSYLLTVGTHRALYGFFTADDLRKGLVSYEGA
nr:hypothetical protein [Tanacetum cinerariifolium]